MTSRVESWLSIDNETSIVRKNLDGYRTRALLDAYMIQLARQRSQNNWSHSLEFKPGDEARLLTIIESPSSTQSDFYDAIRLLAAARGSFGTPYTSAESSQRMQRIFSSETITYDRKIEILRLLKYDQSLIPIAVAILDSEKSPAEFKHAAFMLLSLYPINSFPGEKAKNHALKQIEETINEDYKIDYAEHIAHHEPLSPAIESYLQRISKLDQVKQISSRVKIIDVWASRINPQRLQFLDEDTEAVKSELTKKIIQQLDKVINSGARITITDDSFRKPKLAIEYQNQSSSKYYLNSNIQLILDNNELTSAIFRTSKSKIENIIKFFEASYHGEKVVKIGVGLSTSERHNTRYLTISSNGNPVEIYIDESGEKQYKKIEAAPESVRMIYDNSYIDHSINEPWSNWLL